MLRHHKEQRQSKTKVWTRDLFLTHFSKFKIHILSNKNITRVPSSLYTKCQTLTMQVVSQNKHLYAKSLNGEMLYSVKPYDGSMFCRTLGVTNATCLTLKA